MLWGDKVHSRHVSSLKALRITDGHRGGKQGCLFISVSPTTFGVNQFQRPKPSPLPLQHASSFPIICVCFVCVNRGVCVTGCYLCVCISSNLIEQSLWRRSPGRLSSPRALEQEKVGWRMRTLIPVGGQKASGGIQLEGEQRVRRFQGWTRDEWHFIDLRPSRC